MTKILFIPIFLLLGACMHTPDKTVLFSSVENGGCARSNGCASVSLFNDGSYELSIGEERVVQRGGETITEAPRTFSGKTEPEILEEWRVELQGLEGVVNKMTPVVMPPLAAPYDGIDYMFSVSNDQLSNMFIYNENYSPDRIEPFLKKSLDLHLSILAKHSER